MPANVILTCIEGPFTGKSYSFQARTTFLIGRSDDCLISIPRSENTMKISRHHCLIEICPPAARIRDFGSLNGTYLNGKRIGSRDPSQPAGAANAASPQCDLSHGDTISIGNIVFTVAINAPALCDQCGSEIAKKDKEKCQTGNDSYKCLSCQAKEEAERRRQEQRQQQELRKKELAAAEEEKKRRQQAPAAKPVVDLAKPDIKALLEIILEKARAGTPEVQNIKGYKILKTLGQGGMGAVYLAQHEGSGKEVALKVMLPQMAARKDAVDRFKREMENATALRHPNIVESFDSGFSNNIFYLTMEVCNAGSLQELMIKRGGKLSLPESLTLINQAMEGLKYLHSAPIPHVLLADGSFGQGKGLVHRDLKPANLFLNASGNQLSVKIADLGLAKAFDQAGLSGLTMTGQMAGSPPFMPRQQVVNYLHATPEVDVWALAATLYYILTGTAPRNFSPGKDIWLVILQSDAVPIRTRNPAIPPQLAAVIDHALIDKPRIGFATIEEFQREVMKAL